MSRVANHVALAMTAANQAVLVDVREPAEFWEGHLPGAVNLPSTQFDVWYYQRFSDLTICLVCHTGRRASRVAAELRRHGLRNVFVLEQQMENLAHAATGAAPSTLWSIDRQFRMTLGLLLLTFLLGYFLWSAFFIVIPVILSAGLIITSIIDRCYLRMGIAMLPWNRRHTQELPEQDAYRHIILSSGNAASRRDGKPSLAFLGGGD